MGEVIRGVNFPSYLVASFLAGYVMMGVDLMLEGFLGLFGTYRDYMEFMRGWGIPEDQIFLFMAVGHQINSFVLGLFFVHPRVYPKIPLRGLFKGLVFGFLWNVLAILVAMVSYMLGAEFMRLIASPDVRDLVSITLLHLVWGGVLGLVYNPPETVC